MVTIRTNITEVAGRLASKMAAIANTDQLLRTIATNMHAAVKDRIHSQGRAADGNQIGTYSNPYLRLRTEGYKSDIVTRGKNKGLPRTIKKFNRTGDSKVILSLTRQMENDFSVVATDNGYGLGYINDENFKKVDYNEKRYGKKIFALTQEEGVQVNETAIEFVNQTLNGTA
jgi:hypothetical protein